MTVTATTTQHGISVSLTVPARRYRIIRRAHLHHIRPHHAAVPTPTPSPGFWQHLQTWLLHPDAEHLHNRQQLKAAMNIERSRQQHVRLFLHFP